MVRVSVRDYQVGSVGGPVEDRANFERTSLVLAPPRFAGTIQSFSVVFQHGSRRGVHLHIRRLPTLPGGQGLVPGPELPMPCAACRGKGIVLTPEGRSILKLWKLPEGDKTIEG